MLDYMDELEYYYKYEATGETNGKVNFFMYKYRVVRKTLKGVFIDVYGENKFILNDAKKRYAYPTEDLARISFVRRKERQISILTNQLKFVKRALIAETTGINKSYFEDFSWISVVDL